jgi:hypothetical protein
MLSAMRKSVMPVKTGIHERLGFWGKRIPASAGMTG